MPVNHRDNARAVIAEIARASGMQFARDDRLSRDEAAAVIRWAQGQPEIMKIYGDPRHPDHAELARFSEWTHFFESTWPQTEDGEPVEWAEVPIKQTEAEATAEAQAALDAEAAGFFAGMSAEQASERIEAAFRDPKYADFRAAYADRKHPDHAQAVAEMSKLHQIVAGTAPEGNAAPAANPAGMAAPIGTMPAPSEPGGRLDPAGARQRIDELYRDQGFMTRYGSRDRATRDAANAEIEPLFKVAYPEQASAESGGPAAADAESAAA
jgi:hypothetical protein